MDQTKACTANCELFGKYASFFESQVVPLWGGVYDMLVARSGVRTGSKVLDVGTGTGEIALRVAEVVGKGGVVMGVDAVDEMLEIARRKADSRGHSNVQLRRMSVEELDLPESSFDSVLGNYSLCCCLDYEAALAECLRVLKPGGRLTYNHNGLGDPVQFEVAYETFEKFKTKTPTSRLSEIRKSDETQKAAVEKYRDPTLTLNRMRSIGFEGAEATITQRVIRYKDANAFLDRILGFNWRNEADEIPDEELRKFRKTAVEALRPYSKEAEFHVKDDMVFFTGVKPQ